MKNTIATLAALLMAMALAARQLQQVSPGNLAASRQQRSRMA